MKVLNVCYIQINATNIYVCVFTSLFLYLYYQILQMIFVSYCVVIRCSTIRIQPRITCRLFSKQL